MERDVGGEDAPGPGPRASDGVSVTSDDRKEKRGGLDRILDVGKDMACTDTSRFADVQLEMQVSCWFTDSRRARSWFDAGMSSEGVSFGLSSVYTPTRCQYSVFVKAGVMYQEAKQ